MSIAHPDLCDVIAGLTPGQPIPDEDRKLLEEYAAAPPSDHEDQLDRHTRELVEGLTDSDDVWGPRRAARALLGA